MKWIHILLMMSSVIFSKRMMPQPVKPVRLNGIEYSAPHKFDCKGCVEARVIESDSLLWRKEIYSIQYDSTLETDVHDVFIKELKINNDSLIIINELNQEFMMDVSISEEKCDTLFAIFKETLPEIGSEVSFVNKSGKTIVPFGNYHYLSNDTIIEYGIVLKPKTGAIAIDNSGAELYEVFWFDNGPDYPSDGLFRIKKNGLIGFADFKTGEIVISPQFDCAFPFKNGKAKVSLQCDVIPEGEHSIWKSSSWFFINKNGMTIDSY